MHISKRAAVIITVLAFALLGTGAAFAASSSGSPVDGSGNIHGCYTQPNKNGTAQFTLQNVGTNCPNGSTAITWNQTGQPDQQAPRGQRASHSLSAPPPHPAAAMEASRSLTGSRMSVMCATATLARQPAQADRYYGRDRGNRPAGTGRTTGTAGTCWTKRAQRLHDGYCTFQYKCFHARHSDRGFLRRCMPVECTVVSGGWESAGNTTLNGEGPGPGFSWIEGQNSQRTRGPWMCTDGTALFRQSPPGLRDLRERFIAT